MINKKTITDLSKSFSIENIEKQLIYNFVKKQKLDFKQSLILTEYLDSFIENEVLASHLSEVESIKDLENYMELLIPEEDRKLNGAFFTPNYIVDYIIKEIDPQETDRNIDPSSGCGAFLIGLTDFYHTKYSKSVKQTVRENIFGSDILDYNIKRAKLLLTIFALIHGEFLEESDFNLYVRDSLRHSWEEKFDNVVGNPPYVKFQDLSDENRTWLAKNWETVEGGTFNIYFAFFELGYKILKENGKLGYITPNNYFTSLAAESLRRFLSENKCITRIVDFSHKKVFDVQTYTAITFLQKQKNESLLYDRIESDENPNDFLVTAAGSENKLKSLNNKKWRLLKTDERKNIETIEGIGTPINIMFDICVGIATLKDELFFVDGLSENGDFFNKTGYDGRSYKIERDVTRSIYKISDFKTQSDVTNNSRRIIFPYSVNGSAAIISESIFKERFPYCYEYLLSVKEELLSRDKGKVKFDPFYAWGRTQGLTKFGKKIINPTFSQHPRFLLVEDEEAFYTNGYGMFFKDQNASSPDLFGDAVHLLSKIENIDLVQKVLNSEIMHYYITKTSVAIEGGYPCYQKNFISKFTIPEFSNNEIQELRSLSKHLDINEFLIAKYHLDISPSKVKHI
ncbi:hypothetical protein KML24007_04080 [Alistipes indistinctus]|uniref:HsdM family class I SAM-dependent methyltransferase n=1 Tax=Alistipes indistinctus TaxID=626932 RepID=UPI0036F27030